MKRRENGANVNLIYLIKMAKIVECHGHIFKGELSIEKIEEKINKSERRIYGNKKTTMGGLAHHQLV